MSASSERTEKAELPDFFQESLAKKYLYGILTLDDLKTRCAHLKRRSCKKRPF